MMITGACLDCPFRSPNNGNLFLYKTGVSRWNAKMRRLSLTMFSNYLLESYQISISETRMHIVNSPLKSVPDVYSYIWLWTVLSKNISIPGNTLFLILGTFFMLSAQGKTPIFTHLSWSTGMCWAMPHRRFSTQRAWQSVVPQIGLGGGARL